MSETPDNLPVLTPPPPPALPAPRYPGRNRLYIIAGALGLIALAVVLLTLPTGESGAGAAPPPPIAANPAPPPASPPAVATTPPAPPPPAPPPAAPSHPAGPTYIDARALPRGTELRVDGRVEARRRVRVEPGRHVLGAVLDGYRSVGDTLTVSPGATITWTPRFLRLPPGHVAERPGATPAVPPAPSRRGPSDDARCRDQVNGHQWADAHLSCGRAASAGSASAARALGILFQDGNGVRHSDDSAARWMGEAARRGDASAMYLLAVMTERGRGVRKDQTAALDWYTRAGNAGNAAAEAALGAIFEKGRLGAARSRDKALLWYRKAAAQGDQDAARKVTELGP